jgi:hypothetical protein
MIRRLAPAAVAATWLGTFGSTPSFVDQFDANLAPGVGGGGDADVDLGSTGTLHLTSLIFFFNPVSKIRQLGVSAVSCPNANVSNDFAGCKRQIIDTTQADRQWITSRGSQVWIAYHDSGSSTTVHVQRSDDDGFTWKRVGDPITGNGPTTGGSTFNNENGPIVAGPTANVLYDVYAYGTASVQKGTSADFNNVAVARSMDGGVTWTTTTVFSAPRGSVEDNVFRSLAVDPANGNVYATGVICTGGISNKPGTRNLLDLFEIAIDPQNGEAGIIYTDDTLTTDSAGNPLPHAVLAQQN